MMTRRGALFDQLIRGSILSQITKSDADWLAKEAHKLTPPRYIRANEHRSGRFEVAMLGKAIAPARKPPSPS